MYLFKLLGEAFRNSIFTAKRDDAGSKTAQLYNGFKTIADAEVLAGNLATSKGNLFKTTAMTAENAVDVIEEFIDAADEKLRGEKTILFCNKKSKTLYERAYRNTYGHLNYNKEFNKTYIDGDQKCEIVGLSCVPDGFKLITPKNNMLVGIATEGEKCNFEIERVSVLTSSSTSSLPCSSVASTSLSPRRECWQVMTLSLLHRGSV